MNNTHGLPKWGRKERKTTKNKNKFESKDNEKVRGQRRSHRATTKSKEKDNDTVSKVQQRQNTKQNKVTRQTRSQDNKVTRQTRSQDKQGHKTNKVKRK